MSNPIRIIITEDHLDYRRSISLALHDYEVETIGEASNGIGLLELLETLKPDVILLDIEMAGMDGNETLDRLLETHPDSKVIILSSHDSVYLVDNFMRRGAKGFFSKHLIGGRVASLSKVIKDIHNGATYKNFKKLKKDQLFTPIQKDVIVGYSEYLKRNEIAKDLEITPGAVEKQKKSIMKKLGIKNPRDFLKTIIELKLKFLGPYKKRKGTGGKGSKEGEPPNEQ